MSALSYTAGAEVPAVPEGSIGAWLDAAASAAPDRLAIVMPWQDVRWSWSELHQRVEAVAKGLLTLQLQAGDRVGICAPNCVEWVLVQLATARLGLILVSINPAYRTHELGHALRLSGVRALVTASRFKTTDYLGMLAELMPSAAAQSSPMFDTSLPDLRYIVVIGGVTAGRLIGFDAMVSAGAGADLPPQPQDAEAPINIQFTSGTTGAPKGATLSHRNLLHNASASANSMQLAEQDILCIPVPLYHCFGMVLGVLVCLVTRAAMVFPGMAFDPATVLGVIERERCTALHGVPTMFLGVLDHPEFANFDLTSLRTGIVAGAPCPPPMMRRMIDDMHLRDITIGYGMTETSPLSTQTRPGADLETRTETVGQMLPHFEGKVVNDAGELIPLGEVGEYCSRGPGVMLGYWSQPDATAASIRDGWMHSGDLATMDTEGRVRIVGRIKDMIIRGGENVYPAEVEAFLLTHPEISDAAVFGVPDQRLGEQVYAWVRVRRDISEEHIREWCRSRIAHHKVPSIIRIVDSFPMTVTGKVQKFVMRDMVIADQQV
jgi:fatty-acyl-CoA synthase